TIHEIDDPDLGPMTMQGPLFRLSDADAVIAHTGRPHGADTAAVLRDLGFSDERIAALRAGGDI
ncbi:MAG: CoA transferase, partial [Cellulomonas sp.]|nr:CoA transferase [Cellulomonas sp.]